MKIPGEMETLRARKSYIIITVVEKNHDGEK